jgi:hypothetical protein
LRADLRARHDTSFRDLYRLRAIGQQPTLES